MIRRTALSPARRTLTILAAAAMTALLAAGPVVAGTSPESSDAPEAPDGRLLLVLDASGSMEDPDGSGDPKIESARSALESVLQDIDDEQRVGLRFFGSTVSESNTAAACGDSELAVPVGTGNRPALDAAVADYQPFGGETPIGYALQQAGQDLGSEGQRTILLVSDGLSTCDPDPCEVAQDLSQDGIDLAIHVVGFDVDAEARAQLQCIAAAGNGSYLDATDSESLASALTQVSTRAFRPFTIAGTPVQGTTQLDTAPVVGTGQFTDALSENAQEAKYYRIERTSPGSTLHAGVTMRPDRGGLSSYLVTLATLDGGPCGTSVGTPWSAAASSSFATAAVSSSDTSTCRDADALILSVATQSGSPEIQGEPFELVVAETPRPANEQELPGPADTPGWEGLQPGTPVGEVVAGSSLNDAPLLEPGQTVSSELTRGEIVFFRVPVDYGQRLEALVEFPQRTGALAESTKVLGDIADLTIISPTRGEVHEVNADLGDLSQRATISRTGTFRVAGTTAEVRWANRSLTGAADVAGDYYVGVSLSSQADLLLPVPFTISTQLVGEVSGVPEFADPQESGEEQPADGQDGDGQDGDEQTGTGGAGDDGLADDAATSDDADQVTQPAPVDGEASGTEGAAEGGTSRNLLIGLGALGTALLGAGAVVLVRALRS